MGRRKLTTEPVPNIAWKRTELVMLVRSEVMKVREAARQLNASVKTYYVWERKILTAALQAATNHAAGRPATVPDPEKERLRTELAASQQQVAELSAELKAQKLYSEYQQSRQEATGSVPLEEKKGR